MAREKFDKTMDDELLKNDFKYYDDWKYGPEFVKIRPANIMY